MAEFGVARHNDIVLGDCEIHGVDIKGKIISSSSDVEANGRGVARIGDKVEAECGHVSTIVSGSTSEKPNNKPGIARQNSTVGLPNEPYKGRILTGSTDTRVS